MKTLSFFQKHPPCSSSSSSSSSSCSSSIDDSPPIPSPFSASSSSILCFLVVFLHHPLLPFVFKWRFISVFLSFFLSFCFLSCSIFSLPRSLSLARSLARSLVRSFLHTPRRWLAIPIRLSLVSFSWLFFLFSFFLSFSLCCFSRSSSPSPTPCSILPLFTFPHYFIYSTLFPIFIITLFSCSYIIYFFPSFVILPNVLPIIPIQFRIRRGLISQSFLLFIHSCHSFFLSCFVLPLLPHLHNPPLVRAIFLHLFPSRPTYIFVSLFNSFFLFFFTDDYSLVLILIILSLSSYHSSTCSVNLVLLWVSHPTAVLLSPFR